MLNKSDVRIAIQTFLKGKTTGLRTEIDRIKEAIYNETKSSAGDKHETGRAMAQAELERLQRQLQSLMDQENLLKRLDSSSNPKIKPGSLILMNGMSYYLSVGIGKIKVDETDVWCISAQSPLGALMMGKKSGDTITFNEKEMAIKQVD